MYNKPLMKLNLFKNKSILLTGGTGSFGQKFTENLCKFHNFKKLIIFSRDELKQSEMKKKFPNKNLRFFLGDIRDFDRINNALDEVNIVVHSAALKQVPAAEYNPSEFIKTNIIGTENVIRASINNNVEKVMSLSTDKAASPINLYGATKLVADKLISSANNMIGSKKIIFSSVRYGNVLNSRGSVIPLFKELAAQNKTISITDIDSTRFILSLQEGVNFVINSIKFMKGGEIFVPKINSIKIIDLANHLAPNQKKQIIGLRPGEKVHEILISKNEAQNVNEFNNFYVIKPAVVLNSPKNFDNYNGEKGKKVKNNFEYDSFNNKDLMSAKKLKKNI